MTTPYEIDREESRKCLDMLGDAKSDDFDLRLISDINKTLKAITIRGQFSSLASRAKPKQNIGYGVFVQINKSDGKGFKDENIIKIRFIFIDIDTVGIGYETVAALLQPHMIVESSPGKYHVYWQVSDCDVSEFKHIQTALATLHNGDKAICNPSRVMRLPGTWHLKGEPFKTSLVECHSDIQAYTVEEIKTGLGLVDSKLPTPNPKVTKKLPVTTPNHSFYEFTVETTGEVFDLASWATLNRSLGLIDIFSKYSQNRLRGGMTGGKQHIQCPFEHSHTDQTPDTATFISDKGKNGTGGFIIHCMHNHCADRGRLEFLKEMFRMDWLPISLLTLTTERKPQWVNFPTSDILQAPDWSMLNGAERRIALDLVRIAWTTGNGTVPDNDEMLRRYLEITIEEWLEYRNALTVTGWLISGDGRCWNTLMKEEYVKAAASYNKKITSGWLTQYEGSK